MQVRIEAASLEHLEQLADLFDAYRQFFTGRPDRDVSLRFVKERLHLCDSAIFIAAADARLQGFIQLYPLWSSWYCARIWFLSDLYVAPAARKAGAGSMLVERVKEYAREKRLHRAFSWSCRSKKRHSTLFTTVLGFMRMKFSISRDTFRPDRKFLFQSFFSP